MSQSGSQTVRQQIGQTFIRSFRQSRIQSINHSGIQLIHQPFVQLVNQPIVYSCSQSFSYSVTQSAVYSLTHSEQPDAMPRPREHTRRQSAFLNAITPEMEINMSGSSLHTFNQSFIQSVTVSHSQSQSVSESVCLSVCLSAISMPHIYLFMQQTQSQQSINPHTCSQSVNWQTGPREGFEPSSR